MENETSLDEPGDVLTTASRLMSQGTEFALAVVVETQGETPRKPGAKMIVTSAGEMYGTIGGGAVESEAIERAKGLLAEHGKPLLFEMSLEGKAGSGTAFQAVGDGRGQDARAAHGAAFQAVGDGRGQTVSAGTHGQDARATPLGICGGRMRIYIEPFFAPRQLLIFGAGHVSAAVCPVLGRLSFSVTVYDDRKERFLLSEFKSVRQIAAPYSELEKHIRFHKELNILVMTPNHAYDLDVVRKVLAKEWAFLGVLGSRKKRAEFIARLEAEGFPAELIAKVRMPLGIEIGSETPAEIAISIAAEFVRLYSVKKR